MVKYLLLAALSSVACSKNEPYLVAFVGSPSTAVAAQMAVEDVNAGGGINGRQLALLVVEETYLTPPAQAITVAERLSANDDVLAVVGHGGSGTSLAASQVYNSRRVPQVAPTTSSPLYSDAGPYSFSLVANDLHQARFIASRVAAMSPTPRVAVLYVSGDYGRALSNAFSVAAKAAAVHTVYEAPIPQGSQFTQNVGEIAQSLARVKPALLVWIGRPEELAVLLPHVRRSMPTLRVLGSDAMGPFREMSNPAFFDGVYIVSYVDLDANRPALKRVAERYHVRTRHALSDGVALSYDAVGLLANTLRAGAITREAIRQSLDGYASSGRKHVGITTDIGFDAQGDARPSFHLFEITQGELRFALSRRE